MAARSGPSTCDFTVTIELASTVPIVRTMTGRNPFSENPNKVVQNASATSGCMPTVLGFTPGGGASSALANAGELVRMKHAIRTTRMAVTVRLRTELVILGVFNFRVRRSS